MAETPEKNEVSPTAVSPASIKKKLNEVLPKAGLVYSEKGNLSEVLCKPKIMPIKSVTLEKIEQMEKDAAALQQGNKNAGNIGFGLDSGMDPGDGKRPDSS